ncbi:MAG: ABC transporter permease subunit, partial [Gemmatimonadales bacterium]|nr:ABC transporter permease subunit [Gemmatimonadales bacterium]
MILRALLGHHWQRHRVPLVLMALAGGLFEWAITRVAPSSSARALVEQVLQFAPPALQRILGEEMIANVTPAGVLGFGYVHPFLLVLMSVWVVRVSAGALAGEMGLGTMDLIASRPVARTAQVGAAVIGILGGISLIAAAAWAGTAIGVAGRPLEGVEASAYLPIAGVCWLLFAAFGSVGLAISATRRDAGSAIAWTSAVIALSFVLDYLGRAWDKMAPFGYLSLFRYYGPPRILRDGSGGVDVAVLASVAGVG